MRFVSIPARNLCRRPVRSVLTALGVALAVGGFVALVGFSRGMERAWTTSLVERDVHMTGIPRGTVQVLAGSIDETIAARVARFEGVRDAAGELAGMVMVGPSHPVLVVGWPPGSFLWTTLRLSVGHLPGTSDVDGVVLGQGLADALHLGPGESLPLLGASLVVKGIFRPSGAINNNLVILSLPTLQRLLNRPGKVTILDLRLAQPGNPARVKALQARLGAAFPDLTFTETRFVADSNNILRLIRAMTWGVSLVALTMGFFTVLNTVLMSVTERVREFGVLSALGWSPSRVLTMVVIEGLVLSMAGSAAGILLGIAGLRWLADAAPLRGLVEPEISARLFLEVFAVTLFLGVVGSLYPAGRAVRVQPVEALKHE